MILATNDIEAKAGASEPKPNNLYFYNVLTCILSFIWDWYKNLKFKSCQPENLRF